jgi:hypothetical protein
MSSNIYLWDMNQFAKSPKNCDEASKMLWTAIEKKQKNYSNHTFECYADHIDEQLQQLDEISDELRACFFNLAQYTRENKRAIYVQGLPSDHPLEALRLIIAAAAHAGLVAFLEVEQVLFLPSGEILPDSQATIWEERLSPTQAVDNDFPKTLNAVKQLLNVRMTEMTDRHGMQRGKFYYMNRNIYGQLRSSEAGIQYVHWEVKGGKDWYYVTVYIGMLNDDINRLAHQFQYTSADDKIAFEQSFTTDPFTDMATLLQVLLVIESICFTHGLDHLSDIQALDYFINANEQRHPKLKYSTSRLNYTNLIVARLAENPRFEEVVYRTFSQRDSSENLAKLSRLINYLRDEVTPITNTIHPLALSLYQPDTLDAFGLYFWDPEQLSDKPDSLDAAIRIFDRLCVQPQEVSSRLRDFAQCIQTTLQRDFHNYPNLINVYHNLLSEIEQSPHAVLQLRLPHEDRLLAQYILIKSAQTSGLVTLDGQTRTVYLPTLITFAEALTHFADKIREFTSPAFAQISGAIADFVEDRYADRLQQKSGIASHLSYIEFSSGDFIQHFEFKQALQACNLYLDTSLNINNGAIILQMGHVLPERYTLDWLGINVYLDAKLAGLPSPRLCIRTMPATLLDGWMSKHSFKKDNIPFFLNDLGYYRQTTSGGVYLKATINYVYIPDDVHEQLRIDCYITDHRVSQIYRQFDFAQVDEIFVLRILPSLLESSCSDRIWSFVAVEELDTVLTQLDELLIPNLDSMSDIKGIDLIVNGELRQGIRKHLYASMYIPHCLIVARLAGNPHFERLVDELGDVDIAEWGANAQAKATEWPKLVQYLREEVKPIV